MKSFKAVLRVMLVVEGCEESEVRNTICAMTLSRIEEEIEGAIRDGALGVVEVEEVSEIPTRELGAVLYDIHQRRYGD